MSPRHQSQKGTVMLVALCLVAVLGISLASYIALCSRAMNLSHRAFQTGLSQQLAESGLEEALRAFNKNDWSDWSNGVTANWSTSGTTATCALVFPATKFGQGVTGSVKIRIDNYNANQLDSTWSSSATYRINDLVGYNGIWYRCVQNHTNQTPGNLAYWVQSPASWTWISNNAYAQYAVVNYNGTWYRCHTAHTSSSGILPTNTSYWSYIPAISLSWSSGTSYLLGTMLFDSGNWYYCIKAHTSSATFTPTNATYWAPVLTAAGTAATPGANTYVDYQPFSIGDYIFRGGGTGWLRCIAPPPYTYQPYDYSAGPWEYPSSSITLPYISWAWRSGVTYSFNDLVFYSASGSGSWYRCKIASTTATPTTTTDWDNALSGSLSGWNNAGIKYNLGDVVYYGSTSQWYRCIKAHTSSGSITPSNATYWSNAPLFSTAWDSGRQYSVNDTVRYNGTWYRCTTANNNSNPASSGNWSSTANSPWNPATSYTTSSYVSYGGVWYDCISANTGKSPNNSTYWSALGAPVVYAEGTVNIPGSPSIKTLLRATLAPAPLFPNAAAATTTINAPSGGTVDSYNSVTDPTAGTPGDSAVLAAGGTTSPSLTLTNTTVKGYAAANSASTSPYAPLVSFGPNAYLTNTAGTVTTAHAGASNVDDTRISRSPFIPQFDILPLGGLAANWATTPKGTLLPTATTVNLGTPGATTPSRYYYPSDLIMGGGTSVITTMNINGPVILYINGDLILSASSVGRINIKATGSAEIHASGGFRIYSNSAGINNQTLDAKRLILISDNTSAEQYYNNIDNPLYGVIYAPNITEPSGFRFNSGGGASTTLYGAVSAAKITYLNNMNIHYDTSLRYATFGGVDQPYAITEWRELTDLAERVILP